MKVKLWTIGLLMIVCCLWPAKPTLGQDTEAANTKLNEQRKLLASLKPGMSSDEVLKVLGKPDEVRTLTDGRYIDGTLFSDPRPSGGIETTRWAYGILGKGKFASVGIVAMNSIGKVVVAIPSDMFLISPGTPPTMVAAKTDSAVETSLKVSCQTGIIELVAESGNTAAMLRTRILLKNSGTEVFELKHHAVNSLQSMFIVEVYDTKGTLLFREVGMRYLSGTMGEPAKWPVLSIPPGKDISLEWSFSPARGFGNLPPGKYSTRVYFPFEKDKPSAGVTQPQMLQDTYFPSNLATFEVK